MTILSRWNCQCNLLGGFGLDGKISGFYFECAFAFDSGFKIEIGGDFAFILYFPFNLFIMIKFNESKIKKRFKI